LRPEFLGESARGPNSKEPSMDTTVTRQLVADKLRTNITADLFGVYFPLQLEPFVYAMTSKLSEDYSGGYWHFYQLSNGGFYMAPDSDGQYAVVSENGFEGFMSGDALGISACLYAYSHLSFGETDFADTCGQQYHLLREFMFEHGEVGDILRAID
jgi:hypothetical protein